MYDFPREPARNVYTNKTFIHNLHDYCKYTDQWKLCGKGMLWLLSCLNDVWHIPEITSAYLWFLSFSWSGLSPHDNINDIRSFLISHIFNRHKHIKTYLWIRFQWALLSKFFWYTLFSLTLWITYATVARLYNTLHADATVRQCWKMTLFPQVVLIIIDVCFLFSTHSIIPIVSSSTSATYLQA